MACDSQVQTLSWGYLHCFTKMLGGRGKTTHITLSPVVWALRGGRSQFKTLFPPPISEGGTRTGGSHIPGISILTTGLKHWREGLLFAHLQPFCVCSCIRAQSVRQALKMLTRLYPAGKLGRGTPVFPWFMHHSGVKYLDVWRGAAVCMLRGRAIGV